MSVEKATAFLAFVQEDGALQAAIAALRGPESLEKLVALAEEQGFHFTVDDYREAVILAAEGELSDEALEKTAEEAGFSMQSTKPPPEN